MSKNLKKTEKEKRLISAQIREDRKHIITQKSNFFLREAYKIGRAHV